VCVCVGVGGGCGAEWHLAEGWVDVEEQEGAMPTWLGTILETGVLYGVVSCDLGGFGFPGKDLSFSLQRNLCCGILMPFLGCPLSLSDSQPLI
jgi:hypothetical protein